jgi:amidase
VTAVRELVLPTARELAARIASREVSPVDVLEDARRAYEERNPRVNAIVTPTFDRARAEAVAAEKRIARGDPPRRLEGVPFAVKDSIATAEVRTTSGSPHFAGHVPAEDAIHVKRLRDAGAILVGKTNTPEFEVGINTRNPVFGQTVNPWDETLGCGGSSGGSAVALATGMCALADGTDHGGSIRIPASLVGVCGLRPSPGRVPLYPTAWVHDTLSVAGPLARSARDLALMLSVMGGPDARIPISLPSEESSFSSAPPDLRGRRVAWSNDLGGLCAVDAEIAAAVRATADVFVSFGCIVEEAAPDWRDAPEIIPPLRAHRTSIVMDAMRDRAGAIDNPWLGEYIERSDRLSLRDVAAAEAKRTRYWERTVGFFSRYALLLAPATQFIAFPKELDFPPSIAGRTIAGVVDAILATYAVTIAGLPALTVPCAISRSGLPIGLQIVGPWRADGDVLRAGIAFEEATTWRR